MAVFSERNSRAKHVWLYFQNEIPGQNIYGCILRTKFLGKTCMAVFSERNSWAKHVWLYSQNEIPGQNMYGWILTYSGLQREKFSQLLVLNRRYLICAYAVPYCVSFFLFSFFFFFWWVGGRRERRRRQYEDGDEGGRQEKIIVMLAKKWQLVYRVYLSARSVTPKWQILSEWQNVLTKYWIWHGLSLEGQILLELQIVPQPTSWSRWCHSNQVRLIYLWSLVTSF